MSAARWPVFRRPLARYRRRPERGARTGPDRHRRAHARGGRQPERRGRPARRRLQDQRAGLRPMRTWFWTLLLAVVAVALAVALRSHSGNAAAGMAVAHRDVADAGGAADRRRFRRVCGPARAGLAAGHSRPRAGLARQRAQARDHELLERGWISLLEGRYSQAEKDLTRLLDQTKVQTRRVLAALSSARAAHGLSEFDRRDRFLASAQEHAGTDPGLLEATATVSADMLLDQGAPSARWPCWRRRRRRPPPAHHAPALRACGAESP